MKITLQLETLACPTCSTKIESALKSAKGVTQVAVPYNASKAKVEFDESLTDPKTLSQIVTNLGYEVIKVV